MRYETKCTIEDYRFGLIANRIEASAGVSDPTPPLNYFKKGKEEEEDVEKYVAARLAKVELYNAMERRRKKSRGN